MVSSVLPTCLGHTTGARMESCYGHEVTHQSPEPGLPDPVKGDCIGDCRYDFTLLGEFDYDAGNLVNSNVGTLRCGSVYQC